MHSAHVLIISCSILLLLFDYFDVVLLLFDFINLLFDSFAFSLFIVHEKCSILILDCIPGILIPFQ